MTQQQKTIAVKLNKGVVVTYETRAGVDSKWIVRVVNDDGTVQLQDIDNPANVCIGVPIEHIKAVLDELPPVKQAPTERDRAIDHLELVLTYLKSL